MDFEFTEEQKMIKDAPRRFMEKEIIPIADEWDRKYAPLPKQLAHQLLRKLAPFGYISSYIPVEQGGEGTGQVTWGILYEELSRAWAALANLAKWDANWAYRIAYTGSDDQRKRFLPGLLSGDKIGCGAVTEPNVGSDASGVETKAVWQGDRYVMNGAKTWISNGAYCDLVVVTAQREENGKTDISRFVVEKAVSPFEARHIHKMGLRACSAAELSFSDCEIPKENFIADTQGGRGATLKMFNMFRPQAALMAVGLSHAAIEASVKYARERTQFGRPIAGFQLVQEMIADMVAETDAARLLTYRAFQLLDKDARCRRECSLAKLFATRIGVDVTSKAIQIHGAYGLSDEYPVERYFRDARVFPIPDGTTEIQKLIVGREVLGINA